MPPWFYFILTPLSALKRLLSAFGRWVAQSPARIAFVALIAASAFLCWRLAAIDGERDKWRDIVRELEAASAKIEAADKVAVTEAAERRQTDAAAISTAEKERNDEIAKAAPGRPSDAAVALGCERLRQAGKDASNHPACR